MHCLTLSPLLPPSSSWFPLFFFLGASYMAHLGFAYCHPRLFLFPSIPLFKSDPCLSHKISFQKWMHSFLKKKKVWHRRTPGSQSGSYLFFSLLFSDVALLFSVSLPFCLEDVSLLELCQFVSVYTSAALFCWNVFSICSLCFCSALFSLCVIKSKKPLALPFFPPSLFFHSSTVDAILLVHCQFIYSFEWNLDFYCQAYCNLYLC